MHFIRDVPMPAYVLQRYAKLSYVFSHIFSKLSIFIYIFKT